MALPHSALPREHFACPEDAKAQIERALEDHRQRFGQRPQGMWPSEGSVSEQTAVLIAEAGVRWVATDEAILAQSLQPEAFNRDDLYETYQFKSGGKALNFFFRDHELSDAIGFVYAGMKTSDAVNDFIQRLHTIRGAEWGDELAAFRPRRPLLRGAFRHRVRRAVHRRRLGDR